MERETIEKDLGTQPGNDENSPPSPKVKKLKRRSSVAIARRMSRASAVPGLTLEDQLNLVPGPEEASVQERLTKVLNAVVRNTCRSVEREETEDGQLEEAARKISRTLMDGCIFKKERLDCLAGKLENVDINPAQEDILPNKVRILRDYTKKLEDESKQWSKFLLDRNRLLKQADSNQKEAQAGSIKIDENQMYSLSAEDKKFIRSLPDLTAAMISLQQHEDRQALAADRMARESLKLKGSLAKIEADLEETARCLGLQASGQVAAGDMREDDLDPRDILEEDPVGPSDQASMDTADRGVIGSMDTADRGVIGSMDAANRGVVGSSGSIKVAADSGSSTAGATDSGGSMLGDADTGGSGGVVV